MSHIHFINGYANDAAQIQDHLERLSAARLAKRKREAGKSRHVRMFDSAIDADHGPDDFPEPRREPEEDGESTARYA